MSIKVMNWVWENSTQEEGSHLLTLIAIANSADDEGVAWPSVTNLARKARVSPRQMFRILSELKASGELVTVPGGGRKHNTYRVVMTPDVLSPVTPASSTPDLFDRAALTPVSPDPKVLRHETKVSKATPRRRQSRKVFESIKFEHQEWIPETLWLKQFLEGQTTFVTAEAKRLLTLDLGWWLALEEALDVGVKGVVDRAFLTTEFANMKRWMLEPGHKVPAENRVLQFVGNWLSIAVRRKANGDKRHDNYQQR